MIIPPFECIEGVDFIDTCIAGGTKCSELGRIEELEDAERNDTCEDEYMDASLSVPYQSLLRSIDRIDMSDFECNDSLSPLGYIDRID